jgi:hypothetical protein
VRTDGNWFIDEPIKTKADSGQVQRIVDDLYRAKPIVFGELSSSKATHGLEPPGLKVTLRYGSERAMTINVGDVLGGGRSAVAFVTTSERPDRPIAINRDGVDGLFKDPKAGGNAKDLAKWVNDYRTKQVFSLSPQFGSTEDLAGVSLVGRGDSLTLTKVPEGWQMSAQYKQMVNGKAEPRSLDKVDADPTGDFSAGPNTFNGVRSLVGDLTSLQGVSADDFLPDDAAKLVEYGLADGNPDRVTVELKIKQPGLPGQPPPPDRIETAYIGKKVENATNKLYVRVPGIPGVIRASIQNADALFGVLADPTPLRNRNLFPSDPTGRTQVQAIDIIKDGKTTRLRQPPNTFGLPRWQLWGEPGDPQDANTSAITKIVDVLTQPRTVKDFPAPNDANFTGPELKAELKVWTELETDPKADSKVEPKTKGNGITFQFGKVDRDAMGKVTGVYVRRILANGAKADFILPGDIKIGGGTPPPSPHPQFQPPPPAAGTDVDVLATISKTRLELLDPRLKDFATSSVAKVAIANGPNTLEMVFDDKSDPPYFPAGKWTYTRFPTASPDKKEAARPADEGETRSILTALATLSAGPFKSEKRDDTLWTTWGLNPAAPRMKVTVTLKAPPPPVPVPGMPTPPATPPEERIFYFGNDQAQDGKTYVFARQEGRDAVFLVDKALFDRLAALDLRDRTVVRFDRNKAKKVTVAGWYEKNKYAAMLVFEKKPDGTWVSAPVAPGTKIADVDVTSPTIVIDPNKIPMFIGAIDGMHAEAFLPGGQKVEYGFSPKEKGLVVVIEVEGGKTISLNIAGGVTLNPDKTIATYVAPELATHYVVNVDSAADPSVNPIIVTAGPYKQFKETPGVFGK